MAKRKPRPKNPKPIPPGDGIDNRTPLTDAELAAMSQALAGTAANVYDLARKKYKKVFQDADWERLKEAGVFKCVECGSWKPCGHKDKWLEDVCDDCGNGDDEGDE